MKAIICSVQDIASANFFERFVEKGFRETSTEWKGFKILEKDGLALVRIPELHVFAQDLDALAARLGASEVVFTTKHKSETGRPTLTAHPTGVFGPEASHGGKPHELSFVNANTVRNVFLEMKRNPFKDYAVSLEVTHHGPTQFKTPLCFVEIGSSEKQWADADVGAFMADCVLNGLASKEEKKTAVGFGGGHYAPKFSDRESEWAFGHMCPKYALEFLDEVLVAQMFEKTLPGPVTAVVDEKGTPQKQKLFELLNGKDVVVV